MCSGVSWARRCVKETGGGRVGKTETGRILMIGRALDGRFCWWIAPTYRMADDVWRGFKAALADEIHRTLWPRLAEGGWKPAMDQIFPLAEAGAAHARMQAGAHVGKIVLVVA